MPISIIFPCYNEQEVIQETHQRRVRVLVELTPQFEIVYVDDGRQVTYAGENSQEVL